MKYGNLTSRKLKHFAFSTQIAAVKRAAKGKNKEKLACAARTLQSVAFMCGDPRKFAKELNDYVVKSDSYSVVQDVVKFLKQKGFPLQ
jgi:hypothetical protein